MTNAGNESAADQARPGAPGHQHGSMNIEAHQQTFVGFIRAATWVVGLSIATLIFIALVNS